MTPRPRLGSDADWIAVTAGNTHSCGIRSPGELYCWGSAMLGDGAATTYGTPRRIGSASDWPTA